MGHYHHVNNDDFEPDHFVYGPIDIDDGAGDVDNVDLYLAVDHLIDDLNHECVDYHHDTGDVARYYPARAATACAAYLRTFAAVMPGVYVAVTAANEVT